MRNSVLDAVESPENISDTTTAWHKLHSEPGSGHAAPLLMQELSAFAAAAEVAEKAPQDPGSEQSWRKRLLGMGETIVGSLSDVLKLSERAKAIWKIFGELCSLFKGQ